MGYFLPPRLGAKDWFKNLKILQVVAVILGAARLASFQVLALDKLNMAESRLQASGWKEWVISAKHVIPYMESFLLPFKKYVIRVVNPLYCRFSRGWIEL